MDVLHEISRSATRAICAGAVAATVLLTAPTAGAQYTYNYTVFHSYTGGAGSDGSPFADPLCSGITTEINYDNNPLTNNPKIPEWCPAIGPAGADFGAQFSAFFYAPTSADYSFYLGSDDGSALFVDGVKVVSIIGEQPFSSQTVFLSFLGGTSHTYLIDYYANTFGGSAIQATIDMRIPVSAVPVDWPAGDPVTATPEPATLILVGTGLALLVGFTRRKRKSQQAVNPTSASHPSRRTPTVTLGWRDPCFVDRPVGRDHPRRRG
ncbi:MAG: PA14 domain-containing protein [bacterium]